MGSKNGPFVLPFIGTDSLVDRMKGLDSLSGWDVLVSYDTALLNKLLAERVKILKLEKPDVWEVEDPDIFTGATRTIVFDVTLVEPQLSFTDGSNNISLTFGLKGKYWEKKSISTPQHLPDELMCKVDTSIVSVNGRWNDDGWNPEEDQPQKSGDKFVVLMDPGASLTRGICIDLPKSDARLMGAPGHNIPEGLMAHLEPLMKTFIEKHFSDKTYRLYLAAVSNHYNVSEADSEALRPQHFCFTISGNALLTWIGLKGGPNTATRESGTTSVVFAPGSSAASPIPKGSTASVIFSHWVIANLFIGRALRASSSINRDKVTCTSVAPKIGMTFTFEYASNITTVPHDFKQTDINGSTAYFDGCSIDLNENLCTLTLDGETRPSTSHSAFGLSWESKKKVLTSNVTKLSPRSRPLVTNSSCSATFSWKGTAQWTASSDSAKHPNQLGIMFTMDGALTSKIEANDSSFWMTIGGYTKEVPRKFQNLKPTSPTIDLKLKPMDYLLTTNLLLPGHQVFCADDPAPDSAEAPTGIATPRDTILTGKVTDSLVAARKAIAEVTKHRQFLSRRIRPAPPMPTDGSATLDDLKEALLASPVNGLLGDFLQKSTGANPEMPAEDVLEQYGFGHLANESILSLYGTSVQELLGEPTDAAPPTLEPSSIDLRLYAGYYVVSQPTDDSGEQFVVQPLTGIITMRGEDITPQQHFDPQTKTVTVTWQLTTGETYSVQFTVFLDEQSFVIGTRCEGTMLSHDEGLEPVPFAAYQMGFGPPSAAVKPRFDTRFLGLGDAEQASYWSTIVQSGVYVLTVAAGLGFFCWKRATSARQIRLRDDQITALTNQVEGLREAAEDTILAKVRDEYGNHVAVRDQCLENLTTQVDKATEKMLRALIARKPDLLNDMLTNKTLDNDARATIESSAADALRNEARTSLGAITEVAIKAAHDASPFRKLIQNEDYYRMVDRIRSSEAKRVVEKLQEKTGQLSSSYSELACSKIIDKARTKAATQNVETLAESLRQLNISIQSQMTLSDRQKSIVEVATERYEKSGTAGDKQALEDAEKTLQDIEADIKKAEADRSNTDTSHEAAKADKIEKERVEEASKERERLKRDSIL